MELYKWQKALVEDYKDLEVLEVITVRGAGKNIASLAWASDDSDVAIIITDNKNPFRKSIRQEVRSLGIEPGAMHVVANLDQIRGIHTHPKKKLKVVVDEYFAKPDITLEKLDKVIGHENYKVLFIGSRRSKEDKFKIPFSKQLSIDLTQMIAQNLINPNHLASIFKDMSEEDMTIEFGTPFENN